MDANDMLSIDYDALDAKLFGGDSNKEDSNNDSKQEETSEEPVITQKASKPNPNKTKEVDVFDLVTGEDSLEDDQIEEETTEDDSKQDEKLESKPDKPVEKKVEIDPTKPIKADEKQLSQLYSVKIDGEEKQIPLKDIINGYSKATGADKRFLEASEKEKVVVDVVNSLTDPDYRSEALEKLLNHTGENYKDWLSAELGRMLRVEMMSEDERKVWIQQEKDARDLKEYRKQAQILDEQKRQKEQLEAQNKQTNDIGTAIESDPWLSKIQNELPEENFLYVYDKFVSFIDSIAKYQESHPDKQFTMADVVMLVKDDIKKEILKAPKLPVEELNDKQLEQIGKSTPKPKDIEKKEIPGVKKQVSSISKKEKKSVERTHINDFMKEFGL